MGIEGLAVTSSQDVTELEEYRERRIRRQEPPTIPVSTTTWVTHTIVVEETTHPQDDSGNRQLNPDISDSPSPAAIPTPAPSTAKAMNSSPQTTGQAPNNATQADTMASKSAPPIDSWTKKILIAAGSIGATLVVACLIILIYRRKKKKKLLPFIGRKKSSDRSREPKIQGPFAPIPPWQKEWQSNNTLYTPAIDKNRWEFNSSAGSLLKQPQPAYSRPDTSNSHRSNPLAIHQTPSQSRFPPPNPLPSPSPLGERSVLYVDPRASRVQFTSTRRASIGSSSPVFPIEGPGINDSAPSQKRRSSTPSIAASLPKAAIREMHSSPPKSSRFSWTNSQAPKTPQDASRFSIATSASSVPRYRTVESWVGSQASRLDESVFQGYLEKEIEQRMNTPSKSSQSGATAADMAQETSGESLGQNNQAYTPPPQANRRYVNGTNKGQNHLRASDFMQHPGTKIVTPRVSLIPSEILDSRVGRTRESVI